MITTEHQSRSEVDAAWDAEIGHRIAEIEAGTVTLLTHERFLSVFDEARAELSEGKRGLEAASPRHTN
jgi:hypothetical protein